MNLRATIIYAILSLTLLFRVSDLFAQNCENIFSKRYPSGSAMGSARHIDYTTDDKLIVTGNMQELPYGTGSNATLLKLESNGNILSAKKLVAGDRTNGISHNKRLSDGNFLLLDYLFNGYGPETKLALVKYDANLNVIWTKTYALPFTYSGNCRYVESADGTLFVYFQYSETEVSGSPEYSAIAKMDAQGNFLWCKSYRLPGSNFFFTARLTQLGDNLYFSAEHPSDAFRTYLYKVDKASGSIVWVKRIGLTNSELSIGKDIAVLGGKIILSGGLTTKSNNFRPAMIAIDEDGSLSSFSSYSIPNGTMNITAIEASQGRLIVAGSLTISGTVSSYQMPVAADLSVSTGTMQPNGQPAFDLAVSSAGVLAEAGTYYSNNFSVQDVFVEQHSLDGKLGNCPLEEFTPVQLIESVTITNVTPITTSITLALENIPVSFSNYFFHTVDLGCTPFSACSVLSVTGTASICRQDSIYSYKAIRSSNCLTPVTWSFDATAFQQTARTDSTIQLRALKSGQFRVKAAMKNDCGKDLADSLTVAVSLTDLKFTLGNDRTLCTDSAISLRSDKTFSAYTWQDGSSSPTFRVTAAGIYHLTVSDGCGNSFRDSVTITGDPAVSLGLSPQASICARDTLKLTAANGFTNYQWTSSTGGGIATGPTVSVSPGTETKYFVKAVKPNGCPATDSTRVMVTQSAAINLGADTSFCDRDSIWLNAGSGFTEYLWSNGSTLPRIYVNRRGSYSILARSANGCYSRDTLTVVNVYPNPQVSLGPDLKLCTGEVQELAAGNYSEYRWQDGSGGKTLSVSRTGTYWVTVRDLHQCRGSDTVQVVVNDCLTGVHIPNAFSPDGNGNNDVFRAKVSGEVVSFEMMIYNRYGQKVFSTTDKTAGWDGRLNGRPQDAGSYVYVIRYQLPNAEPVTKKGVLVLVR
jgi:gliding motility-associated-like protein